MAKNKLRMCVCKHLVVSDSVLLHQSSVARQVPLSMEFSKQEYLRVLSFTTPEDLPEPGIELMSLASPAYAGGFFTIAPPRK